MDRLRRLPLRALLPIVFVLVGALYFGIGLASDPDGSSLVARAYSALAYAVLMTIFFGLLIRYRRRRAGGVANAAAIQQAVRSGGDARVGRPRRLGP